MSIESYLTRELDIRFIDARDLTNEARMSLGIVGYPNKKELRGLREEALRIFHSRPENHKINMRRLSYDLEAMKQGLSSSVASTEREDSASSDDAAFSFPGERLGVKPKRGWLKRSISSD